ncbi:tol-pal system protein YbgF [Stutzerimonas kirkiae]|uniref:Cell division coordinator CpoB n=1 Tax=Stutzerimonas kirkiae TaxID=2211392 RepID=A0A4Q9R016_9GAMM|nr:tol-pal system protein YbgF [Stutzerimonas kirkiae]TBU91647.1 tol-pal system protein YbgF [Stutzerimonas kirkiae]TBV00626.1 tol-pal system protein YbgF [Stutzerimonas kirkiae]TBV10822.1 tol-pal system protein YbgF [Stutzerimonas kirkiae]TBV14607.1 tol-pal system protein YbgF [Stutzerimonas kirkiae]
MREYRRLLSLIALSLPLTALAVPVSESDSGAAYGSYPVTNTDVGGAYAGGGATAPSSAQGMLFMQLQQMQQEIAQLRGLLEEQQNQIQRMQQEGLERYQDLDRRLSGGAAAAPSSDQNSSSGAQGTATSATQSASAAAGDPEKEKLFYDAAFDLIKAKDFDKASQAFAAFLRRYPNSQYAGNAQYWLGEVTLANGDLQGAAQAFAKVSETYPQHGKVPDALYKLADVEMRLGNREKAQGIFRQVIAQYPNSSAAQLSQRQLNR